MSRAIGSGNWAQALIDDVDAIKLSGQPNGIVNLALDLTQVNPDGTVTTRYELTPAERQALEYARQNRVLIVVAAGNDGGVMSGLGQSSQEFDNIITVGAANGFQIAPYSSYGYGLNILAPGGTTENPVLSTVGEGVGTMAGTSVATTFVTGAASNVWAENPNLSYRQVIEILKDSATDLNTPGWDIQTGSGLLNTQAAVELAKTTTPQPYNSAPVEVVDQWSGEGEVTPQERAANRGYTIRPGDTLWDIAAAQLGNPNRWTEITRANGSTFTSDEARKIQPGSTVYLPLPNNAGGGSNNFGGGSLNFSLGQILGVVPSSIRSYAQNSIPLIIAEAQRSGITDPAKIAYILATAQQESLLGKYMYELASGDAYEGRRDLGNTQPGDGRRYKGRGFVQITGRNNYANWSRRLGIDLINNPDLAADPAIAAKILVQGMRDGSFTGVGLGNYINGSRQDFYNARRIVNGTDKASYIATLAANFWNVLRSTTITNTPVSNLPTTGYRSYYVRPGDTPSGIALRELGNAARWREILKKDNNILSDWDTRNLQVGQLLRLPFGYQTGGNNGKNTSGSGNNNSGLAITKPIKNSPGEGANYSQPPIQLITDWGPINTDPDFGLASRILPDGGAGEYNSNENLFDLLRAGVIKEYIAAALITGAVISGKTDAASHYIIMLVIQERL
ncbi:MAG: S8 family serine peptidase [Methylacidiphilales bacterium]|nr:S8 family serine peptidase [Candidatus Methylacidiphilales bacterium]